MSTEDQKAHRQIIGKTAFFEPQPSLRDSAKFYAVFTSLDFATIIFFSQSKVVSHASNPNKEDQVFVFMSPRDRVAQLYPQAPGSLFVLFCYSQGYSGGILEQCFSTAGPQSDKG
jgi:hypothetical protein